jgi:hypothetical protein
MALSIGKQNASRVKQSGLFNIAQEGSIVENDVEK